MPLVWAYGITATKERWLDLFPRTRASLHDGGFDQPRVFLDGSGTPLVGVHVSDLTTRWPKVGAWGNFWLSLSELWVRNPLASRFALFQDDLVCGKNLRQYLERCPMPLQSYLNLFTAPENHAAAPAQGWFPAKHRGKGALALVFDRWGLHHLLTSPYAFQRPTATDPAPNGQPRGTQNIDGAVAEALHLCGITETVHCPSLVQHTGDVSTLGHRQHPPAPHFLGTEFDCLRLP